MELYDYLKERMPDIEGIEAVYRVRDRFRLDELIADIRATKFPCIAVEVSTGGRLNIKNGICDRTSHTFHVLDRLNERESSADSIQQITRQCKITGRRVMRMMQAESRDINAPCYGLDDANIYYDPIGPVGMGAYGCTYNFVITNDNVSE